MNIAKVTRRQRMQEPTEKLLECLNAQLPLHCAIHCCTSHLSLDGDICNGSYSPSLFCDTLLQESRTRKTVGNSWMRKARRMSEQVC